MSLRFARKRPDGGVAIITAAPKEHLERLLGPMTDAQYRDHVLDRNGITEGDVVELPDAEAVPDDRTFRDAWSLNGRGVEVDMGKARDIHMGRIRRARDAKLSALDVLWMRASARKDDTAADAIEADRQKLRDIPQTFGLGGAASPKELKALWPKELLG